MTCSRCQESDGKSIVMSKNSHVSQFCMRPWMASWPMPVRHIRVHMLMNARAMTVGPRGRKHTAYQEPRKAPNTADTLKT